MPAILAHPRLRFAAGRLVRLVASLAVLVTLSFAMIHLIPGDPVRNALGLSAPASLVEQKRHDLGLDRPLLEQYGDYWRGLASGDLGTSISTGDEVATTIGDRLPSTLTLAGLAFLFVVGVAFPLGLVMAALTRDGRNRAGDLAFTSSTGFFTTVPDFVLGTGLVALFAVGLGALPVAGQQGFDSYLLPVVALGLGPAAVLARVVRVESQRVLATDYMRTARSKRLPGSAPVPRHALPNTVTGSLTIGGLILSGLVGGTVLVESVFAWPGLGSTIVQSVLTKDYPLVQGVVLVLGIAVLVINSFVDVALAHARPALELRGAVTHGCATRRPRSADRARRPRAARAGRDLRPADLGRRRATRGHATRCCGTVVGAPVRHRRPRPRHPRSRARRDAAVARAGRAGDAGRVAIGVAAGLRAGVLGPRRRAGSAGTIDLLVAFPA